MEGVNLIKIYCKHVCKYHMYPPVQLLYANKNAIKKRIYKWDCIKLKIFCTSKDTITTMKRLPTELTR
jgi:hypothetical protein